MIPTIPFRIRLGLIVDHASFDPPSLAEFLRKVLTGRIHELMDQELESLEAVASRTPVCFQIMTFLDTPSEEALVRELLSLADTRVEFLSTRAGESPVDLKEFCESRHGARSWHHRALTPSENSRYLEDHSDVVLMIRTGDAKQNSHTDEQSRRPMIMIEGDVEFTAVLKRGDGLSTETLKKLDAFNRFEVWAGELERYVSNEFQDIFGYEEAAELRNEAREAVREKLLPFYAKASLIAKSNQKLYSRAGFCVYVCSVLAVICVALGTLFSPIAVYAFFAELILLSAILLTIAFADRRRSRSAWIENRFLAERIRSAEFFAATLTEASPVRIQPHLREAHAPAAWVLRAFQEIWNRLPPMKGCSDEAARSWVPYIQKAWIGDQMEYHKRKANSSAGKSRRLEKWGMVAFSLALIAAIVHLILLSADAGLHRIEILTIFLAISLPAAGAAIGGIRSHREYSRLARRSSSMAVALYELNMRCQKVFSYNDLEPLLRQTDELMLMETQDWLMLMQFVVLEPT